MTVRFHAALPALLLFLFFSNAHADDPITDLQSLASYAVSAEAQLPAARLASISKVRLPTETESAQVNALPDSTVAAIRELYVWLGRWST